MSIIRTNFQIGIIIFQGGPSFVLKFTLLRIKLVSPFRKKKKKKKKKKNNSFYNKN